MGMLLQRIPHPLGDLFLDQLDLGVDKFFYGAAPSAEEVIVMRSPPSDLVGRFSIGAKALPDDAGVSENANVSIHRISGYTVTPMPESVYERIYREVPTLSADPLVERKPLLGGTDSIILKIGLKP
jgi:hypothetical protein